MSRFFVFRLVILLAAVAVLLGLWVHPDFYLALIVLVPLIALGVYDLNQTHHAILRNYPLMGHFRYIFEYIRPEIRQYFFEDERDPLPFSRDQRAIVYQRAKNASDMRPFGTVLNPDAIGYGWLSHSIMPAEIKNADFRITIGGATCAKPYSASVLNISGMSFGAIGAHAVLALNQGAKQGNFAQDTGEGSISPYHLQGGGDIIWQVATGYFGCRTPDGKFDPALFTKMAQAEQVKMIEIKLSQGAKPGHGGVLPKAKITPEIAATRLIDTTHDCISPARHSAFSTPVEMMQFLQSLRELSGGKPVGFKLCVGHRFEVLAIIKAMLLTEILPDFIVVDGAEGGTGAAPMELSDHVGLPLVEGLSFMNTVLTGAGLRDDIKLGASGKMVSAFDFCRIHALGADYVMAARAFMFSLGCVQARACHTNKCPTGITTQDKGRQRALVVEDKAPRVASFHRNTLGAIAQVIGAAGLTHPDQLRPWHVHIRNTMGEIVRGDDAYPRVAQGALLSGHADARLTREWDRADPHSFAPRF
ncbi:FMN-binding glutamate synthase family protein [Asticcacaulis sp. EMRT-3]|uniref:FMN-binding glutamate synthase family protein n=1 Tax=Asticcacaulis sp. EMRT-3 TaxID=3040349 RepID=UPI0024AEF3D3|nr:FMN-binding glutamate synthase family protein [Asticcacaulis sp. EMRT-3]MDI7773970.1 FMN-binding glutamate synthase family protein [Asticcacaulis sp. EMRT-3]